MDISYQKKHPMENFIARTIAHVPTKTGKKKTTALLAVDNFAQVGPV
jgi:hypothetical protein